VRHTDRRYSNHCRNLITPAETLHPPYEGERIVMHAGFHFTSDKAQRMAAGLDRLKRIVGHAERHGAWTIFGAV
jgi:hypothetical protein